MKNTEFRTGVISPIECVKEAFERIKPDYWLLFGITLLGCLIGGVTMYILLGAMMCGIYYAYLRRIDGFPASLDDLWKGFQWFGPGLLVVVFLVAPMILVYAILYVPLVAMGVFGGRMSESEIIPLLIVIGIVDLILIFLMVCFHTLMMFAIPLIVDRNLGAVKAMTTSARAVMKNLGGIVGLILVNMGLVFVGYLALCVGVYFVIPIIFAGNILAYRKVFPRLDQPNFTPPPPTAYGNF